MTRDEIKALIIAPHPSIPVYRQSLELARLVSLDGLGPHRHLLRFVREIHWVRQLETTWRLMKGDKVISAMGVSWGDGRFGISIGRALEGAWAKTRELQLQSGDDLRVEILLTVNDVPTLEATGDLETYAERHEPRPQKIAVSSYHFLREGEALDEVMRNIDLPVEQPFGLVWPWLTTTNPLPEGVVWSSAQAAPITVNQGDAWIEAWVKTLTPREVTVPQDLFWQAM
jgi:hypothetical protein